MRSTILRLLFILYAVLALTLPRAHAAADLAWDVNADTLREIDRTDLDILTGDAFRADVPIDLVSGAIDLLFDESKPDEVPDEIITKIRLYALTIAQRRIDELRATEPANRPSDEDVRASAIAALTALSCPVTPRDGAIEEVSHAFTAPLEPEQEEQMRAYMAALTDFQQRLEQRLENPEAAAKDKTKEDIQPLELPPRPDFTSAARAEYEGLSERERSALHTRLGNEFKAQFSCGGGGRQAVDFETEEELVEGTPLQSRFRVIAVPRCECRE